MNIASLEELEIRIAYQDDTIERLNHVVYEQSRELTRLNERCRKLETRLQALAENRGAGDEDNAPPPHY